MNTRARALFGSPLARRGLDDGVPGNTEAGPATPNRHRNSNADWDFPFAPPGRFGRFKPRTIKPNTERRMPFVDMDALDDVKIEPRFVRSPVSWEEFRERMLELADDVGLVPIDHPAIAHELAEVRYIYPHARSLIVLIGEENKPSMQSRYLPTANHELYECEERLFHWGAQAIKYIKSLGGDALTTTIGWPQEVSVRWADKIWPLSHKLVAQAAGLGMIGTSRNFLHRKYGAYCLIDTVVTNLEFTADEYAAQKATDWNPCLECNLCVASCPTEAIRADGEFDFFACYNHTYRDSIPGFLDLMRDAAAGNANRFEKKWSDAELAALWQSMAFRVEYRCFNCVATCPAEIETQFHGDRDERARYKAEFLKPLTYTRSEVEEQFVIDTPTVREKLGIPPGEWRTPKDPARPGQQGVRLVSLQRIRVSNVDTMMRMMPMYFRPNEAKGVDMTCQIDLSGAGGGRWILRVVDQRCSVAPGVAPTFDLRITCPGTTLLGIHRGEINAVKEVILGRIKLEGDKRLFLLFPRILPVAPAEGLVARVVWQLRRWWRSRRTGSELTARTR
jgi:epoxyqueuosine reductase QueG/putative sterol carrier protein